MSLTIGPKSTMQFFMKRQNFKVILPSLFLYIMNKFALLVCILSQLHAFHIHLCFMVLQGTISFGVGFFFVVIGWPIIGMILEAYGFIVLFR